MKKFTLYVGLFDKDSKHQEISTLDAFKMATNLFRQHTGGATISEARGIYTHENGEIVVEPTLRCEVFGATVEQIEAVAAELKVILNQEYIAIEEVEVNSRFF